jgi:hypothetical protein
VKNQVDFGDNLKVLGLKETNLMSLYASCDLLSAPYLRFSYS